MGEAPFLRAGETARRGGTLGTVRPMSKSDGRIAGKREEERRGEGSERGNEECSEGGERGKEDSEGLSRAGYGGERREDREGQGREGRTKGESSQRIEIDENNGKGEDAICERSEEDCIAIGTTLHSAPGWGTGVPVLIPGVSGHCKVNGRGDPCQRIDAKSKDDHGTPILSGAKRQVKFVTSLEDDSAGQRSEAPEKGQQPGSSSDRILDDSDEKMGECDEEADQPRIRVGPKMPSKREREQLEALHLPYRSWRRHSVRMRGQSSPHARGSRGVESEEIEAERIPIICMDYFFMSQEDERASANPLLLLDDEANGNKYMRAVGRKGLGEGNEMEWLIKDIHDELKSWGYPGGEERFDLEERWRASDGGSERGNTANFHNKNFPKSYPGSRFENNF